jgi:hypothetical protein
MEKVVNLADAPIVEGTDALGERMRSWSLMSGMEDTRDDYWLQLSHTTGDFSSPRQRHPFDQVRLQLKGEVGFGRGVVMRPGTIAYLPGGAAYGPRTGTGEGVVLILHFGGGVGSSEIAEARDQDGMEDPAPEVTGETPGNMQDSQGAGEKAVFLDPQDFPWADEMDLPGVRRKALGRISSRGMRMDLLGVAAGAAVLLPPHTILFALVGAGRVTGDGWHQHATIRTGGEPGNLTATEDSELLQIHMPPVGALKD